MTVGLMLDARNLILRVRNRKRKEDCIQVGWLSLVVRGNVSGIRKAMNAERSQG